MNGKKIATFNHISGTSFAAPYMAAAVALYFEKHGVQKDIHALRSLLQTTSKPVRSPFSPLISSVAQQGSGLFNIQRAIAETTRVNPSMLLLGEYPTGVAATINKRLEISNFGSTVKVYRVSHLPAATVRGYDARGQPIYPPEHRDAPASVKFSKAITVPAQASTTLSIDITPPENVPFIENWVYS
ncbi:hypothetical protein BDF19DRAFT_448315 [Syncephalis fuscata]|nr:hypothetical protein BDF19DRAFT_448315 [Syncephalis fuscata]